MNTIREDKERPKRNSPCSGIGIGIATAAIGVGVGAALYYYFNRGQNQPPQEAGESARTAFNEQRQVSENYAQISSEIQQNFRERKWSLEECSICFDVMLECQQNPVKMLSCGHKFHVGCINQWLDSHDICPNCRLPARACS